MCLVVLIIYASVAVQDKSMLWSRLTFQLSTGSDLCVILTVLLVSLQNQQAFLLQQFSLVGQAGILPLMGADLFDSFANEKLRLTPEEAVLRFGDPTPSFCFVSEH